MDLEEVKLCLRGLLSSTALSCDLNTLLTDFRKMTGLDLPLFGYLHPVEFLRSLDDTVQLFGNPYNPEIALVQSEKSAHIASLVDRQKTNNLRMKYPSLAMKSKRLLVPDSAGKENQRLYQKFQLPNPKQTKTSRTQFSTNESFSKTAVNFSGGIQRLTIPTDVEFRPESPFISNSVSGCKVQEEKPGECGKNKNSYFEDISDNESCFSVEDFRGSCAASNSCFVNEGIKGKLKKLIRNYPNGLWCCELPECFQKEYNFALDYREYGYTSLIQMLSELPDVFRCVRPGNEDWLLFDASVAPSPEEKKIMEMQATADISSEIAANIKKLLSNCFDIDANSRLDMDKIPQLYKKMFGCGLDFQSLGFKDLRSFLKTWEGNLFSFLDLHGNTSLVPVLKITVQPSPRWEEALPPITAENDIFVEIFPKDVVGPEESLLELDLSRHVAVGNVIKVGVAEVWSPSLFYLHLNKFRNRLNQFMEDLQNFYNVHLHKYKMPDSTIRPKQICVGLYTSDPDLPDEWHRGQIIKVINEKMVLVNFVDFGTETRLKKTHLRFLHRSFQSFPVQGFLAQLSGVAPANGEVKWPISTSKRFLELVQVPSLDAEIVDIDFKKPRMSVVLFYPSQKLGMNINQKLVKEKLACWKEPEDCSIGNDSISFTEESKETKENKAITDNVTGAKAWESFNKNLPEKADEFSDIVELDQPTLFHFNMKSKKTDASPVNSKNKDKPTESLKYEFDDVPDLDASVEVIREQGSEGEKGATSNNAFEEKDSEFAYCSSEKSSELSPQPPDVTFPTDPPAEMLPRPRAQEAVNASAIPSPSEKSLSHRLALPQEIQLVVPPNEKLPGCTSQTSPVAAAARRESPTHDLQPSVASPDVSTPEVQTRGSKTVICPAVVPSEELPTRSSQPVISAAVAPSEELPTRSSRPVVSAAVAPSEELPTRSSRLVVSAAVAPSEELPTRSSRPVVSAAVVPSEELPTRSSRPVVSAAVAPSEELPTRSSRPVVSAAVAPSEELPTRSSQPVVSAAVVVSSEQLPSSQPSAVASTQELSTVSPELKESSQPIAPDFSLPSGKPKRLPPGLENPSFEQIGFFQSVDDLEKKINILAMDILATNPSIKQVGINDPLLAMKIAKEMALVAITSKYSKELLPEILPMTSVSQQQPITSEEEKKPEMTVQSPRKGSAAKKTKTAAGDTTNSAEPNDQTRASPKKAENEYVTERRMGGKIIHVVTVDGQLYFCVDEIVRTFTTLPSRDTADRILSTKKVNIGYRILTKATDEKVIIGIKSSQLKVAKTKTKKLKVYLIPLGKVVTFLQALGCSNNSIESDFLELQSCEAKVKGQK